MDRRRMLYRFNFIKDSLSFWSFKDFVLIDKYPFSITLSNLKPLNKYGDNIILGINDPDKYWVHVEMDDTKCRYPGVSVNYKSGNVEVSIISEDILSLIIEYRIDDDVNNIEKILFMSPDKVDYFYWKKFETNINAPPKIPDDENDFIKHCLKREGLNVVELNQYPYKLKYELTSTEKETCHKENGTLFRHVIDYKGNKFSSNKYNYNSGIPGITVSASGEYSYRIDTEIDITNKTNFPILLSTYNIDYRREFDRHYAEFNKSVHDTCYTIFYDKSLLPDDLQYAFKSRDFSLIEKLLKPLFKDIDMKELLYG